MKKLSNIVFILTLVAMITQATAKEDETTAYAGNNLYVTASYFTKKDAVIIKVHYFEGVNTAPILVCEKKLGALSDLREDDDGSKCGFFYSNWFSNSKHNCTTHLTISVHLGSLGYIMEIETNEYAFMPWGYRVDTEKPEVYIR